MIEFREVSKSFGGVAAVLDFSLAVEKGSLFVLVGPSGSGKSTVMRMINAMVLPDKGEILVGGRDVRQRQPEALRRSIGYVIQSIGLFPHWTAAANILAVPRLLKWSEAQCAARLEALTALLRIDPSLLTRYPAELSGGQQQRISIARALAADPAIVLMDEPFSSLDPVSRAALQEELRALHARSGKTIVFVTHDMGEALGLATHMGVMKDGRLIQKGAPEAILENPAESFVRDFLGGHALELRALDVMKVRTLVKCGRGDAGEAISADASLKAALSRMLATRHSSLPVVDESGQRIGKIELNDIVTRRHGR
ncbi:MAG TPA: ABC transporter ATP-binding protein [Methylocella sp.]|nr:ABC transporter ATP-binding protein [Methylocella sp.]